MPKNCPMLIKKIVKLKSLPPEEKLDSCNATYYRYVLDEYVGNKDAYLCFFKETDYLEDILCGFLMPKLNTRKGKVPTRRARFIPSNEKRQIRKIKQKKHFLKIN